MNIKIKKSKSEGMKGAGLMWSDGEREEITKQILNLRDDQLGILLVLLVGFDKENIREIVAEIRENKAESGYLPILMEEAPSKEDLLWWLEYFHTS